MQQMDIREFGERLIANLETVIVGKRESLELILWAGSSRRHAA